jgi:hypothetical protein
MDESEICDHVIFVLAVAVWLFLAAIVAAEYLL